MTRDAVVTFPAASRAVALSLCEPFDTLTVFHVTEYGDDMISMPRLAPSTFNWTPTTPTLSDAEAERVTVPETVALAAGVVQVTIGAVVSEGGGALPPSCLTV